MDPQNDDENETKTADENENNGPCYFEQYGHAEYGGEG